MPKNLDLKVSIIPNFTCKDRCKFIYVIILFLLAMEPRKVTRWDVHKYARQAYDLGVRYIGGCCGFEPYHIRAIAEEVGRFSGDTFTKIRVKSLNAD